MLLLQKSGLGLKGVNKMRFSRQNLSEGELRVLRELDDVTYPFSLKEVASIIKTNISTARGYLDNLEKYGYVESGTYTADEGANYLITKKGSEHLRSLRT